jgi:hypothetical protein
MQRTAQLIQASSPGLTRRSILLANEMDARLKPARDSEQKGDTHG